MMKPDGAGYRGIGPNAGKFVPADEAQSTLAGRILNEVTGIADLLGVKR